MIVIGGYNSSNTSHLVELCEARLPTYFINNAEKIISDKQILHCNWSTKEEMLITGFLPQTMPAKILITSGASCPDALVEEVIEKISALYASEKSIEQIAEEFV